MEVQHLKKCLDNAARQTTFHNVWGNRFNASVMRKLYGRKMKRQYSLSNVDAIRVRDVELTNLVSDLLPIMEQYLSPETGAVHNGLYNLTGSLASPRLPTVEEYAKILVLAAARIGSDRVGNLLAGWLEGRPIRVFLCALLKGVRTDGRLNPVDGLCLETLSNNMDRFPRSLSIRIDRHDIHNEQYAQRAMLSLEHDVGPALYSTDAGILEPPLHPVIRNHELSSISVGSLCRAMSIEINNFADWFLQWWDYGEVDAFFLNSSLSSGQKDTSGSSPVFISEEQLKSCLGLHKLLENFTKLDLCIARWLRSKQAVAKEEQLVELRIALESVLLGDDVGVVGEKRHRLATRGAWLLGETVEERKICFRKLRDAYDFASTVVHAGRLKKKDSEKLVNTIGGAQDLCRKAILQIASARAAPDWLNVVLGKGFRRVPDQRA